MSDELRRLEVVELTLEHTAEMRGLDHWRDLDDAEIIEVAALGALPTPEPTERRDVDPAHYVLGRDDLREFHHQFERQPFDASAEHRHGPAWSDSLAQTHCICFGAAQRAVAPLLSEIDGFLDVFLDINGHLNEGNIAGAHAALARVRGIVAGARP